MFRSRLWAVCLVLAIVLAGITSVVFQHQPLVHAASTLTVTTTADTAPPCSASAFSLRCAIARANTDGSGDTIVFNIPAASNNCFGTPPVCRIGLSGSLPVLTASHTTINGYTQPGARPNSHALRNGDNAILTIAIDNPTLTQGFDALDMTGSNNTIEGLDITGFLINLYTRTGGNALFIELGSNNNLIAGNFFGVGTDGNSVGPNTNGVLVAGNSNLIGGTTPGLANVASGSYWRAIELGGTLNTVEGNLVGTNAAGTKAAAAGTGTGSDNILSTGSNNTIGGTTSGAGNVISGGTGAGVRIFQGAANAILHNLIGTNAADTAAIPNATGSKATDHGGVLIEGANATVSGNVISGNRGGGVIVDEPAAVLTANFVGVTATGQPLGNAGNGISISSIYPMLITGTIGGTGSGAGNTIAYNTFSGVIVGPASITRTHVTITGNSIFANGGGGFGGLGIDLLPEGVVNCNTPPPGPNDYLPCPIITSATIAKVSGTACAGCLVEVFIATNEADDQGHGEGKTFLGRVTADSTGKWSLSLSTGQVTAGQRVTATATTTSTPLETSEFGANVVVTS
jgi:hypothetical protein